MLTRQHAAEVSAADGSMADMAAETLTDRELEILAIESQVWRYSGVKAQAMRDRVDLSPGEFYTQLNALLDREEALAHDPINVKRLRRLRDTRKRSRSARALR